MRGEFAFAAQRFVLFVLLIGHALASTTAHIDGGAITAEVSATCTRWALTAPARSADLSGAGQWTHSPPSSACALCIHAAPVTWLQSCNTQLSDLSVEDSHLLPREQGYSRMVWVRGGGAIRVIKGSLLVADSNFTRCSAGPLDGDFDSCALSFSASTGLCTEGLGGAISGERTDIYGQTARLEATTKRLGMLSG